MAPQLAQNISGSTTLSFNLRYASVKSAFMNFGGSSTTGSANQNFDSLEVQTETTSFLSPVLTTSKSTLYQK